MPTPQDWTGWSFRLRFIRCGKATCRVCRDGILHGPYWYAYRSVAGKTQSKYVGSRPTSTFEYIRQEAPPPDDRWAFHGRMDYKTALRIFGLDKKPNAQTLISRYRSLIWDHHPDHGGDTRAAAAINAAYAYLKL